MLELTAIRLTQGKFTLQGGLELAQPVTGVFGPSGTGKSALLKAGWGTHRVPFPLCPTWHCQRSSDGAQRENRFG